MGLFGKLPAHGDFVRRGDPELVGRLDAWLSGQLERLADDAGNDFDARLAGLPVWCFRLGDGLAGALAVSHDKVGRIYPLVAAADAGAAVSIAAVLVEARDLGLDADATGARLLAITDEADLGEGWWHAADPAAVPADAGGLPTGDAFARLFAAEG